VEVIRAAVGGLGRAGSPAAARPLFQTLQEREDMHDTVLDSLKRSTAAPELAVLVGEATDVNVRRELVRLLAETHDRRVADALAGLLNDEDMEIKSTAALALAQFGDQRAVDTLFALTENTEDDDLVSDAIEHLRFVASPAATDRLVEMLETHAYRKAAVMRALGATGDARAVRPLEAELDGDDAPQAARSLAMLDDDGAFRDLEALVVRPADVEMAAYNAADRSLVNEELLRRRKGAIIAMGRFGRLEAVEPLMEVVEDDADDYELRGMAAASIGMIADDATIRTIIEKIQNPSMSEYAKRYYVQALWQRPHPALNSALLDLMANANAEPDVRRAAALAVGYAADPASSERLIQMLGEGRLGSDDTAAMANRRNAAFAVVLGGTDEAVRRLVSILAVDADTREVLQGSVMNEENDWFNLVTQEMFETGAIWRRARAAQLMREGEGDTTYSYAWQKVVQVLRSGWEGVGGISAAQIRDKLWDAISGDDEERRALAAELMRDMPERGLLLRARDEGGATGEAARAVLTDRGE